MGRQEISTDLFDRLMHPATIRVETVVPINGQLRQVQLVYDPSAAGSERTYQVAIGRVLGETARPVEPLKVRTTLGRRPILQY